MTDSPLASVAKVGSTFVVTIAFFDEDGNAVTPNSATWTLLDMQGYVVNDREDVALVAVAGTAKVVLSGDDLGAGRYALSICGEYDSTNGSGLPLREQILFDVADFFVGEC